MAFIAQNQKNQAPNQQYLGFWSDVQPGREETMIDHIAMTVNYFIDSDKEEIFFGCDEKELDGILSKIKTESFDVTIIHRDEFRKTSRI